eukprot:7051220-Heterocapsa_arctica.AAC.1
MQLNDGRFSSPETLVRGIIARGELARLMGRDFVAAYIECSSCYQRVDHNVAAEAAIAIGCNKIGLGFWVVQKTQSCSGSQGQYCRHTCQRGDSCGMLLRGRLPESHDEG